MNKPLLMRRIRRARELVRQGITDDTQNNPFARGLATEGFAGGYMAALDDVMLVMNDVEPNRMWWRG